MTRQRKIVILAAAAATLAVAGGGAALAATDAFSSDDSQAIIEDAAGQLGVEPSELSAALKQALKNRVDEAVEEGRLTEEQGSSLKERIDSGQTPLLFGAFGGHRDWGHGPFGPQLDVHPFGHFPSLESAASYLGLTEEELRSELADGKSLGEIAKEQGKTVDGLVQALVDAGTERIDQAVEDGKLTEAQAADLKEGLEERITELVNREPGLHRGFPRRHGYHFGQPGFGFGQFHGPTPPSAGPRAWACGPPSGALRGVLDLPSIEGFTRTGSGVPPSRDCVPQRRDYKENRGEGKGAARLLARARGTSRSPSVEPSPSPSVAQDRNPLADSDRAKTPKDGGFAALSRCTAQPPLR